MVGLRSKIQYYCTRTSTRTRLLVLYTVRVATVHQADLMMMRLVARIRDFLTRREYLSFGEKPRYQEIGSFLKRENYKTRWSAARQIAKPAGFGHFAKPGGACEFAKPGGKWPDCKTRWCV